jgi:hypothetical protein
VEDDAMSIGDFLLQMIDSIKVDLFKDLIKDIKLDKPWVPQIEDCKTSEQIKDVLLEYLKKEYDAETDYYYSLFNMRSESKVVRLVVPKWGDNILN